MNRPEVISIGMVWDSERPAAEDVAAVYAALGTELLPTDAFHECVDRAWAGRATHRLVGLVTYYGKHYSTFFYHSKLRLWIYFDDADVKEIGPEWGHVVDKCRKGRFQPLLLLYAAVDGTPCDTRYAPKEIVPFPAPEPRRAITPAPERPNTNFARRAVTPGPDNESDYVSRKTVENMWEVNRRAQLGRSLSTGSASDTQDRSRVRRDSGNWSGDRNSASSASSSTFESPYMYTKGRGPGSAPGSPTRKGELSSGGSCDAGYDSYSLSSTDSLPFQQVLRHNPPMMQIPELKTVDTCKALCAEADRLLDKSRQAESVADFEKALILCDAAASKASAAMDASFNNAHTMTFARMKHNTCIMRARSLQRRIAGATRISESQQNVPVRNTKCGLENTSTTIEIYATLPKKKGSKKSPKCVEDDIDNPPRDRPPRHKTRDEEKGREKRSRSEDRGRARKEIPIATEKKEEVVEDKKANKKQHKIRRKLLMGGLIRRKNRSMPDLTEGADGNNETINVDKRVSSVDDGDVGRRKGDDKSNLSGYLSEGHLEYSAASGTNPNLERSKLMRKSIHGSAVKMRKVPPPLPQRTTSQLSGSKFDPEVIDHDIQSRPQHPLPNTNHSEYSYTQDVEEDGGFSEQYGEEPHSLPFLPSYDGKPANQYNRLDDSPSQNFHTVITKAMIHQEQSPVKRDNMIQSIQPSHNNIQNLSNAFDNGVDVVDCAMPSRRSPQMFELPPYPSPMNSVNHSRQPSEEFPPPPPPLDLTPLQEQLNHIHNNHTRDVDLANNNNIDAPKGSLLAQLQEKRNQILRNEECLSKYNQLEALNASGETWLKELQAKQATLKLKRSGSIEGQLSNNDNVSTVRSLASRFENTAQYAPADGERTHIGFVGMSGNRDVINCSNQSNTGLYNRRASSSSIDPKQIEDDYSDQKINNNSSYNDRSKPKKKSVSFCDQVILVSTAEDQEDDSYIPNPILERVLKSAMIKPELTTMPLQSEKPSLQRQDSFDSQSSRSTISSLSQNSFVPNDNNQADYVRLQSTYPAYQSAPARTQQQYNAQKTTGVYGTSGPAAPPPNQNNANNSQIYQSLPNNSLPNATNPIPYTQPPSVYQNSVSPPNFSQNPANRLTPTAHNHAYMAKHNLPRNVPNTYPHPPSQLHQINQTQNNAYYHRLPQHPTAATLPSTNYTANRQYNQNLPNNASPYQSVPTNSPAYQSYHNPPTSYASSEYSSRYPATNANHYGAAPSPYQRVPPPHGDLPQDSYPSNGTYQKLPSNYYHDGNANQTRAPEIRHYANSQQQRPVYNQNAEIAAGTDAVTQYQYTQNGYNPYQHMPPPKQIQKKSVSFEPGTKGGTDSPIPPQIAGGSYTNGDLQTNMVQAGQKAPCNLCRKKPVNTPALYCTDCDFYMSRFKPHS